MNVIAGRSLLSVVQPCLTEKYDLTMNMSVCVGQSTELKGA